MSRLAFYLACVGAFAFPIAGVWMLIWSAFSLNETFHPDLRPYLIGALTLSLSMILGGLPGR